MTRVAPIDVPSLLSSIYAPLQPLVRRVQLIRRGQRTYNPDDILLPDGYVAEVVCEDLTAPVHACFGPDGEMYVTESGHKSDSPPRVYRVDPETGEREMIADLEDRWIQSGAATGAAFHEGNLYVANTDTIVKIDPNAGAVTDFVTGLPGRGDHQANHPLAGPDGKIYWGQGCATNMGVVGADNFGFEWLAKFPDQHDVPARDITLAGRNYDVPDVLGGNPLAKVSTGAYVPFGTKTMFGQVIRGNPKASGAILRADPHTGEVETVAWGLRNPYGVAFHPDGRLFATEHGSDERGARFIVGDPDDFYEIHEGAWYGWPDFASGIPLSDPSWGDGSRNTEPVLAEFPDPNPPRPVASFETHTAANGFDFSRSAEFGFPGQAFVAMFGDLAPVTTARQVVPAGFKVVRVDPDTGTVADFAVNRVQGPASKLLHDGFERPSHCAFGPDGNLYVVDFGEIKIAPEKGAIRIKQGTGSVWRIRREAGISAGVTPPEQLRVPFYPIQALAVVGLVAGVVAVAIALLRRLVRRGS